MYTGKVSLVTVSVASADIVAVKDKVMLGVVIVEPPVYAIT